MLALGELLDLVRGAPNARTEEPGELLGAPGLVLGHFAADRV